jgi:hypothetical protein
MKTFRHSRCSSVQWADSTRQLVERLALQPVAVAAFDEFASLLR